MRSRKDKILFSAFLSLIFCLIGIIFYIFLDIWSINSGYTSFEKYGKNFYKEGDLDIALISVDQGKAFIDFTVDELKNGRCDIIIGSYISLFRGDRRIEAINGIVHLPSFNIDKKLFIFDGVVLIPKDAGSYKHIMIYLKEKDKEINKILEDRNKIKDLDKLFENKVFEK